VAVMQEFSDPSGRLSIERVRLCHDFLHIMTYKAMDDRTYSMKDWVRQPDRAASTPSSHRSLARSSGRGGTTTARPCRSRHGPSMRAGTSRAATSRRPR